MSRAVAARSVPLPRARRATRSGPQPPGARVPAWRGQSVELEAAPFRVLTAGVERAQQRAPGEVTGDGEVVAGGEDGGGDRRLDVLTHAEHADVELLLGQRLAEEDALQLVLAVVD